LRSSIERPSGGLWAGSRILGLTQSGREQRHRKGRWVFSPNAVDRLMIESFLLCSSKMGTGPTHKTCTAVILPYSQNAEVGTLFGGFTHIIRPHRTLDHCSIGVQIPGPDYLMARFLGTI
jgi:hypothetical protein